MELWIARDKDGELYIYPDKPYIAGGVFCNDSETFFKISGDAFPQVTWENSPQRVRIEIMEEGK